MTPLGPFDQTPAPDDFLSLTPPGVLHAHSARTPDTEQQLLQSLMPPGGLMRRGQWLAQPEADEALLAHLRACGWVEALAQALQPPDAKLDYFVPHAIGSLSSSRKAVLASEQGFCLGRVGFDAQEADALAAVAADLFDFRQRQLQRGWRGVPDGVSFHRDMHMLLPEISFRLFWVDGVGYWLVLGDEPLLNNRALVELAWGIHAAGGRFRRL